MRRAMRFATRRLGRSLFARAGVRDRVAPLYRRLGLSQKRVFHRLFAKAFEPSFRGADPGAWDVEIGVRTIKMPLSSERMWLDWDNALALAGHDIEVKQTYVNLLTDAEPPDLFVDIGASYGTHSLLFLAHGVDVIAFEPNPECIPVFRGICESNHVSARIECVALGDSPGEATLIYPRLETWLGTLRSEGDSRAHEQNRSLQVPRLRLDDYASELEGRRTVVKIDTEGSELAVLRGARAALRTRPMVIFESLGDRDRDALFGLLAAQRYLVKAMPWEPESDSEKLDRSSFLASQDENFIAVPLR